MLITQFAIYGFERKMEGNLKMKIGYKIFMIVITPSTSMTAPITFSA